MSHIVTIKAQIRDAAALAAGCTCLGLKAPGHATAQLYARQATGQIVQRPGWQQRDVEWPARDTGGCELGYVVRRSSPILQRLKARLAS